MISLSRPKDVFPSMSIARGWIAEKKMWLVVAVTTFFLNILMHRVRRECCQNDSPQNVIDTPYEKKRKKTSHRQPYIELYIKHYRKNKYICTRLGTKSQYRYKGEIVVMDKMSGFRWTRWAVVTWWPSWSYRIMKPTGHCRDNTKRLLLPQTIEWGNDLKTPNKLKV